MGSQTMGVSIFLNPVGQVSTHWVSDAGVVTQKLTWILTLGGIIKTQPDSLTMLARHTIPQFVGMNFKVTF